MYGFVRCSKAVVVIDKGVVDLDMMEGAYVEAVPSFKLEPCCRMSTIKNMVNRQPALTHYTVMGVVLKAQTESNCVTATISDGIIECVVCSTCVV